MLTTQRTDGSGDNRAVAPFGRSPLDDLPDGYYETDLEWQLTYANVSLARLLGQGLDAVIGENWRDLLPPATCEEVVTMMRRVTEQGTPQLIETAVYLPSGSERILELSIAPLMDSRGNPVGVRGIARDVTERYQRAGLLPILHQVDDDLIRAADIDSALELALEGGMLLSNGDAGFIGVLEGNCVRLTHTFGEYKDTTLPLDGIVAQIVRQRRPELIHDVRDYRPALPETAALMVFPLVARSRVLGVLALETADAARFTPNVFEFVRLLVTRVSLLLDVALLLQAQSQRDADLRAVQNQVKELEQLKANLIRLATHDLRNPLSIVKGYMDILRDDLHSMLQPMQTGFFDAISVAIQRIDQITTDIVSLGRVQTALPSRPGPVDLGVLVNKAVMDYREECRRRGQTLEMRVPADPVIVHADETDLVEAIRNLLGNAVKFTPQSGRIEIRLTRADERVRLDVDDTGIGISEEHQLRLFEPFFRIKQDDAAVVGTGLGLYVTRLIIERYGGQVFFKSVLKEGSTFGFELPLETPS